MFFMGKCIAGYKHSLDSTSVTTDIIKNVSIGCGIFDRLFITRAVADQPTEFPGWDYDTVMDAQFNGDLMGGNIVYQIDQISAVRIKRRRAGKHDWLTLFEIPVKKEDDLKFEKYDKYAASGVKYDYALVPVINNVEGYINQNSITPSFSGCFIFEKEDGCSSDLDITKGTITRTKPSNVVTTLSGKYPYVVSNANTDYESGQFSMMFMPKDSDGEYTTENDYIYREDIKAFLNDGKPKIMKLSDGRIWMIATTDGLTEDNGEVEHYVHHSFNWVEIGDPESSSDLYNNNFIDVNLER